MQHLDEGTIHALLDGELSSVEAVAVEEHAQACAECAERLAGERLIQREAERMIADLDGPAAAARPAAAAGPAAPRPEYEALPAFGAPRTAGPPVVLVPEREEEPRGSLRYLGWAAMVAVAVGAGWFANNARQGPSTLPTSMPEIEQPRAAAAAPFAVDEADTALATPLAAAADSAAAGTLNDSAPLEEAAARPQEKPEVAAAPPAAVDAGVGRAAAARTDLAAREQERESQRQRAESTAAATARKTADAPARNELPVDAVTESRRTSRPAPTPAAAAPSPALQRTQSLEQQSQISMRIGLDEARRLLGDNPMHVIDGMRPEFVGMVPGRLVPGADPNEYVVRVVYVDDERRVIYLDQQRLSASRRQTGAARDSVPPDWVKGDVRLSLKGDVPQSVLRSLAEQVR